MGDFKMPSLGADMEYGTVTRWLVKPGDEVRRGDIVVQVETEKSDIEVEIFQSGTVEDLLVGEGERVPVGTVLAHVRSTGREAAPDGAVPGAAGQAGAPAAVTPPPGGPVVLSPLVRHLAGRMGVDLSEVVATGPGGTVTRDDIERAATHPAPVAIRRVLSSPLARRTAAEMGIDLSTLEGTGPGGSVVERDVRSAASGPARTGEPHPTLTAPLPDRPAPAGVEEGPDRHAALRRSVGALMARSKREIPHYYLSNTVDITAAAGWLEEANLRRSVRDRLVVAALLLRATALAVEKVPEMNGFFVGDGFEQSDAVHVGVAVSLRSGGVIAPAIHDADRLSLDELMLRLRDLVARARSGGLRSSEMSDSTITVTNLGDLGVESVFGVIYPPQVALVGFGQVTQRAVAKNGLIGVAPCLTATLSADHRVSDGHRGARFLSEIERLLQEPEKL